MLKCVQYVPKKCEKVTVYEDFLAREKSLDFSVTYTQNYDVLKKSICGIVLRKALAACTLKSSLDGIYFSDIFEMLVLSAAMNFSIILGSIEWHSSKF